MLKHESIVFVINTSQYGGASKMLTYVANNASDWFEKVYVISLFDCEKSKRLCSSIVQIPLGCHVNNALGKIGLLLSIRRTIANLSPSMVCSFISDVAFYTKLSTLGLKTTIISAERGDPYTLSEKWLSRVKWSYSKSDYCVFQTKQGATFFGREVLDKSFVIPNPYISTGRVVPHSGTRKKTIVSGGRLVAQKGFDTLITAFVKVLEKHPEYRLIIYGDGQDREKLENQVNRLGIEKYVDMPGYADNFQEKICDEGIFVLSSRFEGIPNALIEAMAVGLPCVATDCTPGGPRFLCGDDERGLLIPIDDSDTMAEKINFLIENSEFARQLGERAKSITEILNVDSITNMWKSMFEKISSDQQ